MKIFFPNYYGVIENIFYSNNVLFTTLPLKLVNEYESFPTCLQHPKICLKEAFGENLCYLKSYRIMNCNH